MLGRLVEEWSRVVLVYTGWMGGWDVVIVKRWNRKILAVLM